MSNNYSQVHRSSSAGQGPVSIVSSSLWAASADALGWITELADAGLVKRRVGAPRLKKPVQWRRKIGGWSGVEVDLPAGTYSDDTQLRLAVSRAIGNGGVFDVEAFAKIELPTWLSYALGAGRGSKAAASGLAKKGVNWFSNFYNAKNLRYVDGGGNGAAMRIQPHVWCAPADRNDKMLLNVLRDSLVTHGHPNGFCGAIFHAISLSDTLLEGAVSGPESWGKYLSVFNEVPEMVDSDPQLRDFWLPSWEKKSGVKLKDALARVRAECQDDLNKIENSLSSDNLEFSYFDVLTQLDLFNEKLRGSGLKTSIAANALSWLFRNANVEDAVLCAANALGSDTDTIGTMAGAMLGALAPAPRWHVQDREYLVDQALRLEKIRDGSVVSSFEYPDLMQWRAPGTQADSVMVHDGGIVLAGLGNAEPIGGDYSSGDGSEIWQWMRLDFGQTILVKRRRDLATASPMLLPSSSGGVRQQSEEDIALQRAVDRRRASQQNSARAKESFVNEEGKLSSSGILGERRHAGMSLDEISEEVFSSGFSNEVIGRVINRCIDQNQDIESAVALVAIIAKAKLARQRRSKA
ncbi:ADP-ribosylglycohydrolase family protein [Xanthomonas rydalmerensis]|uniref:ADP-ribosylglycohydrolase family protein n=1 Tax=Xanthomonas rydalmerensis TaxID=3046274 RepID=A0ABZ0JJD6_9XANT|nr:ADP-ribosylglycohydrolase family protein [Xanthomonas sp. DM-2023]WOS39910.1 ADP-ribosylglycohydrolase family protein [Xanthomonas sp. DM-2023]WOS44094.1 ADP-ribosylglycohydrolase family protein [Xanthomonas sp. DM-2023]WOS48274.1 ADP-ribosylglycohydrolase family protein [Xanthomonas sp. DM-2023]WOS52453.1 ADP-ribosylglycohydrolase family protein [Xanthomonas sp. DM-2023]WOS56637.1 ADP-ribosylglycohydrolase family protein [Xanthomonas sp. DM-2023]